MGLNAPIPQRWLRRLVVRLDALPFTHACHVALIALIGHAVLRERLVGRSTPGRVLPVLGCTDGGKLMGDGGQESRTCTGLQRLDLWTHNWGQVNERVSGYSMYVHF